ncbi:unnamed protein product [Rhodiola kirilowii]
MGLKQIVSKHLQYDACYSQILLWCVEIESRTGRLWNSKIFVGFSGFESLFGALDGISALLVWLCGRCLSLAVIVYHSHLSDA